MSMIALTSSLPKASAGAAAEGLTKLADPKGGIVKARKGG